MTKRSQITITILTIALVTLPYVFAMVKAGDQSVFNGFLLNPYDGNSYLAKMRLGWSGAWQFTLLFSAEQTQGGFLFLFYIFLGHLARWLGLSLLTMFHLARVVSAVFLCLVLARFIRTFLSEFDAKTQSITFGLVCLGSGLGWLAALFGGFTSDFWVAEAYPFLSMYSNPHFSLGLALVLIFFIALKEPRFYGKWYWMLVNGLLLAIIMPFGVVLAGLVMAGVQVWDIRKRVFPIRWWALWFLIPGSLFLIYQYILTNSDPLLVQWNLQNLTPTPPLWDVLIAFSPALIAAVFGVVHLFRRGGLFEYRLLVVWLAAGIILAYFPFQLQRRFLLGYYIPVVCLAAIMLSKLIVSPKIFVRAGLSMVIAASVFTNGIILVGGLTAIIRLDEKLYYPQNVQAAFDWMESVEEDKPLILTSPETGLIIPGATGWRVIYGHPYETPNAAFREEQVTRIYRGEMVGEELAGFIKDNNVDYIFLGPFEEKYDPQADIFSAFSMVFANSEVKIYATGAGK